MRFIDSNVFIHAILKPTRKLAKHEQEIKEAAKAILKRIEQGEKATTTVVHLSEVANILESRTTLTTSRQILIAITSNKNLTITPTTDRQYKGALQLSETLNTGINDALAHLTMTEHQIHEIYSFDKHHDNIPQTKRITQ
ncbi:MAG: type II toxin-antitoxin system VapC family toxin [Chloroflexi bacterium]|nr:type II toxin-antitoxin system VapC family toxin [Chloroflexota bacterium]